MKKILWMLFVLSLIAAATACSHNSNRSQLEAEVAAANAACPQSLGVSGSLVSIAYDKGDNEVVMSYTMNPTYVDIEALRGVTSEQKQAMGNFLKGESGRQMLTLLDEAGASLRLVFRAGDTGNPLEVSLSSDDIREIAADTDVVDNELAQIDDIVAAENRQCPDDYGEGVVLTGVGLEHKSMVYNITMPDSVDLSTSERLSGYRDALLSNLRGSVNTNPLMQNTLNLLRSVDYSIRYRLTMPDSTTIVIDIAPDEIIGHENEGA